MFTRPTSPLREMTILVDARLLQLITRDEKVKYLFELLAAQPIEAYLYSHEGPPTSARRTTATDPDFEGIVDWAALRPGEREGDLDVVYLKAGKPAIARTQANDLSFRRITQSESPTSNDGLLEQVRADAYAMLVAKAIRADLFITDRKLTVETESGFWWSTTVMSPANAILVVGLYLRQQGKYVLGRTPALGASASEVRTNDQGRAMFYWEASQEILPAIRRWSSACKTHSETVGDDSLALLATALPWRIDQALRSRDRLLTTLSAPPKSIDAADEVLTELDQILLWIMSSYDIAARVAHVALNLDRNGICNVGWQKDKWIKKVKSQHEPLAELVSANGNGKLVVTILNELRNSIHGEALSAGGKIPIVGDHAMATLVRLPQRNQTEVLKAMDKLMGRATWGVKTPEPDSDHYIHPGEFVEQLLPHALRLLNDLVATTPVERLNGVKAESVQLPGERPRSLLEQRIRWQIGL